MQSKFFKKTLALVVVLAMAFTMINVGALTNAWGAKAKSSSKVPFTKVANNGNGLFFASKEAAEAFQKEYIAENGTVRVSIFLDGESALEKGFSTKKIGTDARAISYRNKLRAEQDKVSARISEKVLGGDKLDVVWNITAAGNIISANVPFDKINAISNVIGVKKVVVEAKYDVPVTEQGEEPEIAVSAPMVGSEFAWAEGYTGLGSKVAIIDTGVDVDHELFDAEAFEYALSLAEKDYALLTLEDIAEVVDQLHIAEKIKGISAEELYVSSKIPFGANYVDNNTNIDHLLDGQGAHGSHVAGIATGNRFVKRDNGFVSAIDEVKTQGEAPDAQLIVMKVFGANGGAYDSDYLVAIEDAFVLGCDSVNLSLGSAAAGFATSEEYESIIQGFADSDTVVAISAGNSGYWSEHALGYLYSDDVNYSTLGSPGSFSNAFTVASVNNGNYKFIDFGGYKEIYNETSYKNEPFTTLGEDELEFVYLDGYGSKDEWEAVGGEEILAGKVAIVNRGDISFYVKVDAAAELGAIAAIIVNNASGSINMDLSQMTSTIPAVSVSQNCGLIIKNYLSEAVTNEAGNVLYYTGTLTNGVSAKGEYQMSDFSSWGVPGDLSLKPEITAPGGNILSADGDPSTQEDTGYYTLMSGTSMAAPQIAGLSAVLAQYIKENGLADKLGVTARQLITSLLMSTATPIYDPLDEGYYYSVMKQGAGVVDLEAALNAKAYVTVDTVVDTAPKSAAKSIADGKVKIELGSFTDDEVTVTFTVHNMTEEPLELYFGADFFTQYVTDDGYDDIIDNSTDYLYFDTSWVINGEEYVPYEAYLYDFNGDGVVNIKDAKWLLTYLVDDETEFQNYYMESYADLDHDGDVDSNDAKLAFEMFGSAAFVAEAGEDTVVTLTISDIEWAMEYTTGGIDNYVEGYVFVTEGSSEEGELGTKHSIPVFGYYGDWSAHDMFDKGTPVELNYEIEERIPYMVYAVYDMTGDINQAFEMMANQAYLVALSDGSTYSLGGNPLILDEEYMPERNAVSSGSTIKSLQYALIRNAGATRFEFNDKYGRPVLNADLGSEYSAYYHVNQATWFNYSQKLNLNLALDTLKEGSEYNLIYRAAPEYYVAEDGSVDWDALPLENTAVAMNFIIDSDAPFIVGSETFDDEEGTHLVISAHDNQYIAAVAIYTEDGELVDTFGSVADIRKGEQYDYDFNLTEAFGDDEIAPHLLVEVYDYALNLSTYKINLNPDELEDPEFGVKIVCDEPVIFNKGTLKLDYDFQPWGYEDETIFWTSSDENIATVDDNGLVTSVYAGEEQSVTVDITATAAVDPEASDTITITVIKAEKELNGIIWDEDGNIWLSDFDVSTLPEFEALNDAPYTYPIATTAYDATGNLYAGTYYPGEASMLYLVDPDTFELELIGGGGLPYQDLSSASALGENIIVGTYLSYIVIIDATTGGYVGVFNMSSTTRGSSIVGITYVTTQESPYGLADAFLFTDANGYVYYVFLLPYNGSFASLGNGRIMRAVNSVKLNYWQSAYYDQETDILYIARFESETANVVEIYAVYDIWEGEESPVYRIAQFNDGVWPVGGLFELGAPEMAVSDGTSRFAPSTAAPELCETGISTLSHDEIQAAFQGRKGDSVKQVVTTVKVDILADQLTTNGLIDVRIPSTAEVVKVTGHAQYFDYKINNEEIEGEPTVSASTSDTTYSVLKFAFVDLEGIKAGDPILTIEFATGSAGEVEIDTYNINGDDENFAYEIVVLGPVEAFHTKHIYEALDWNWYVDENGNQAATALIGCTWDDIDEFEQDAEITSEVVGSKIVYTATIILEDDQILTDTLELPIAAINGRSGNFGILGVNFRLDIDESYFADGADVKAVITKGIGDNAVEFEYLASECATAGGYVFTVPTAVKEMADILTLKVYTADGETLIPLFDKDGNDVTADGYKFSMKDYCNIIVANSSNAPMVDLATAYLDFGFAAMSKFNYNIEAVEDYTLIDTADYSGLADFDENVIDDSLETLESSPSSVTFDSLIKLNKAFNFKKGTDVSGYKFFVNGEEVEATQASATRYIVEVKGIAIKNFDDIYTFSVVDENTGDAYTVEYSVLSYFYKVLTNDTLTTEMVNLAKAGYNVYLAAEEYFG